VETVDLGKGATEISWGEGELALGADPDSVSVYLEIISCSSGGSLPVGDITGSGVAKLPRLPLEREGPAGTGKMLLSDAEPGEAPT
jgi:hypothetical protein